ncbi:MAG TPA: c-type cytochrome [Candidatus Acidoferrum sp.]|nr:c-type cytochrome [Candidatus Acidoferrum sp.]
MFARKSGKRSNLPVLFVGALLLAPLPLLAARYHFSNASTASRAGDAEDGRKLFDRHCALCHGIEGKGGRGPALNRLHLPHAPDDAALKTVIEEGIPPNMPQGWFLDEDDVDNLIAYVRALSKIPREKIPGDAARGAGVYKKSGCSACHILNGAGSAYGPELTAIGHRRGAAFLKNLLRKPDSALPDDFLFVRAVTSTDQSIEGIRVNEDTFTIQLKDAGGNLYSLRKADLKELNRLRGETPMPSFENLLSSTELDDLVAFLASQRGKQ